MIITMQEAKDWIRDVPKEDESTLDIIVKASEEYLRHATGRTFTDGDYIAKIFCLTLSTDWYENRELIGSKPSEKVRFSIQSILLQLQNLPDEGEETSG